MSLKTRNFYTKCKEAIQRKKSDSTENECETDKKKSSLFVRVKIRARKACKSIKKRMRKKSAPIEEAVVIQRRVSATLSVGMEPPEIFDLEAYHSKLESSLFLTPTNFWKSQSSVFSVVVQKESNSSDLDSNSDGFPFPDYLYNFYQENKMLLEDGLFSNKYGMQRPSTTENFFEDLLLNVQQKLEQPKKILCKAPIMTMVDDSEWITSLEL